MATVETSSRMAPRDAPCRASPRESPAFCKRRAEQTWVYPYFAFALGLAEYRQDHFERAIALMNAEAAKVLGPCPRLVLAMAQHHLGEKEEARATLAEAISKVDWSMSQVRSHDQWLWHVLRREAEAMIFPNTAAFLEGKYEPRDNTERLALLGVCRFQNRPWHQHDCMPMRLRRTRRLPTTFG